MFTIMKEDFGDLYSRATSVVDTRSELSQEYRDATNLINQLDLAIEGKQEKIIFTESEVQCLSITV